MTNQNNTTDKNVNLLDTVRRLHFVGIGGSGMCPMAEILHHKDYIITGSDINESDTLARIRSYGIPVHMGHRAENIGDAEVVVYTAAAKQDNPELVAARAKGYSDVGAFRDARPFDKEVCKPHCGFRHARQNDDDRHAHADLD